jgi:hypothetical protein
MKVYQFKTKTRNFQIQKTKKRDEDHPFDDQKKNTPVIMKSHQQYTSYHEISSSINGCLEKRKQNEREK